MKDSEIRKKWEEFIEKYSEYFNKDNKEKWYNYQNQVEEYINTNNSVPSQKNETLHCLKIKPNISKCTEIVKFRKDPLLCFLKKMK